MPRGGANHITKASPVLSLPTPPAPAPPLTGARQAYALPCDVIGFADGSRVGTDVAMLRRALVPSGLR
eukprot:187292-Prorocentrum_minimum.AAC.2